MTIIQSSLDFDTHANEPMCPPSQAHSATSVAAAQSIEPDAGTLRGQVLNYLRSCGAKGATDDEIQDALGMNPSTQRPRRIELVKSGHVVGTERTRSTKSKRQAVVWLAKEHVC